MTFLLEEMAFSHVLAGKKSPLSFCGEKCLGVSKVSTGKKKGLLSHHFDGKMPFIHIFQGKSL